MDGCGGQNVDNIVFVGETPMPGQYTVDVRLVDPGQARLPLKVRFGWRRGESGVRGVALTLARLTRRRSFRSSCDLSIRTLKGHVDGAHTSS